MSEGSELGPVELGGELSWEASPGEKQCLEGGEGRAVMKGE